MSIETTEDRASTTADQGRGNGVPHAEIAAEPSHAAEITQMAARIEELERQQKQIRRDSLLVAGLGTIAAALAISTMLSRQFEPPQQEAMQPAGAKRFVAAQAFLLTDPQGHPRARLTFE